MANSKTSSSLVIRLGSSLGDETAVHAFRLSLGNWFDKNARELPWRTPTRDAYRVWVSEIMLQQTRVATVIPYYQRFIRRFPTCQQLACAPLDEVLSHWSGLGYYRRARALHVAAQQVAQMPGALLPESPNALRQLAGIGPYTAAAIASMAFNYPVAVVDGNVLRVLARIIGYTDPIDVPAAVQHIGAVAQSLLDPDQPGKFNEAMMELGALQCTPWTPQCQRCPVVMHCEAYRRDLTDKLPVMREKKSVPVVKLDAHVATMGDAVFLAKRDERGLFGGLWEPPMAEKADERLHRWMSQVSGVKARAVRGTVRHVLTHRVLQVRVFHWVCDGAMACDFDGFDRLSADEVSSGYQRACWVGGDRCDEANMPIGMSSLACKVLKHAGVTISWSGMGERESR